MSGSSITHFVYPCSGENLWNKILSGDSAKGWRRQIQSTDCLQLSQSKGRLFDSSDPREAVRLMREKELSSEPRHACTRKRDIVAESQQQSEGEQSYVGEDLGAGAAATSSTSAGPVVVGDTTTSTRPRDHDSACGDGRAGDSSAAFHHPTLLQATAAGELELEAGTRNSKKQLPKEQSHSRGASPTPRGATSQKQCSKKGPPHFRSSSPFLNGEHFMDAIRKPKITPKVIPNAMELTGRETASDTCIYETSERDRAWSADVEHRWNRPRLTNFWTHNCESRIEFHACSQVNFDWAIKMQEESLRINGKLARLEVPEHRSSMVYKDYYLNQLYKKKRNDRSASTVFGDEKQKLDHKHHYHWTDVNKPFTADDVFAPNKEMEARRPTDLVTDFAHHGFPRSDWSVPGRLSAFQQQRKIIPEANAARQRRKLQLDAMKQGRLENTQVYGDNCGDAWHPGKLYLRGYAN